MKQKVIMICLEGLGIGGVETAVINQASAMIKKGFKVVVLAKDGIYKEKLVDLGVHYINWEFELKNNISLENIEKLRKIIMQESITHVIINQFPCINEVIFACLLENIPYVASVHATYKAFENDNLESNVFEYFSSNYLMFEKYFEIFFSKAAKIVTITPVLKEYLITKFNIPEDKILVIPNSIDLNSFLSKTDIVCLDKFLLVSRFSEEKLDSISYGLKLFKCITEKKPDKNYTLKIVGDGDKKGEIVSLISNLNIKDKVELIGEVTNVKDYMEQCDVVLGIDRCLLEAVAMKRVAVICGYDGLKGIVNNENIDLCINENFSGRLHENIEFDELAEYLINIDINSIKDIISSNYSICEKKLDINKNISILDDISFDSSYLISLNELLSILDFATRKLDEENNLKSKLKLKNWELENMHNHVVADKQLQIDRLNLELSAIHSSRSYKCMQKIRKILRKK